MEDEVAALVCIFFFGQRTARMDDVLAKQVIDNGSGMCKAGCTSESFTDLVSSHR
jgi:hypothetical protein